MITVSIRTEKINDGGSEYWWVRSSLITVNAVSTPQYSDKRFRTQEEAIAEMKLRAMKHLKEAKGRTETEDQINWQIS